MINSSVVARDKALDRVRHNDMINTNYGGCGYSTTLAARSAMPQAMAVLVMVVSMQLSGSLTESLAGSGSSVERSPMLNAESGCWTKTSASPPNPNGSRSALARSSQVVLLLVSERLP